MAPNKNIYIPDDDMPIWQQAEQYAKSSKTSLSRLIATALRRYLPMDIKVIVDFREQEEETYDRPVLELTTHPRTRRVGWNLVYVPPGADNHEVHFILDEGNVPLEKAREHLRKIYGEW